MSSRKPQEASAPAANISAKVKRLVLPPGTGTGRNVGGSAAPWASRTSGPHGRSLEPSRSETVGCAGVSDRYRMPLGLLARPGHDERSPLEDGTRGRQQDALHHELDVCAYIGSGFGIARVSRSAGYYLAAAAGPRGKGAIDPRGAGGREGKARRMLKSYAL
jgi:hypothetical protein